MTAPVRTSAGETSPQSPVAESNSRRIILDRLRSRTVPLLPRPEIDAQALIRFEDPLEHFTRVATSVGAVVIRVEKLGDVAPRLDEVQSFRDARRTVSLLPEAIEGNTSLAAIEDPHDLADLDWLIARGMFGVAENGAIWVPARGVPHRVSFFITQFLAIVLPSSAIEPHMHAAYERIGGAIQEEFGVFISGPSKTADIEQSLVHGAHGSRTLHIFLCDQWDSPQSARSEIC